MELSPNLALCLCENLTDAFGATFCAPPAQPEPERRHASKASAGRRHDTASVCRDVFPPDYCPLATPGDAGHSVKFSRTDARTTRLVMIDGVYAARVYKGTCQCGCNLRVSEYRPPGGEWTYYDDAEERPVFAASNAIIWGSSALALLSALLERTQVSFDGFAVAYQAALAEASLPGSPSADGELSAGPEYKQVEMAWLKREALRSSRDFNCPRPTPGGLRTEASLDAWLRENTPRHAVEFERRWAQKHAEHCTMPGKCSTLTVDGNAKIRRDVCACKEGPLRIVPGQGAVSTGCTRTPARGSCFCAEHTRRLALAEGALAKQPQPQKVGETAQDGASSVVYKFVCSKCGRKSKKFPGSTCIDCPGSIAEPGGGGGAPADPTPETSVAPPLAPPPAPSDAALSSARARVVNRPGGAYTLRALAGRVVAEPPTAAATEPEEEPVAAEAPRVAAEARGEAPQTGPAKRDRCGQTGWRAKEDATAERAEQKPAAPRFVLDETDDDDNDSDDDLQAATRDRKHRESSTDAVKGRTRLPKDVYPVEQA